MTWTISKILVPVDGSECACRAARFAVDLARDVRASVTLMYVFDAPSWAVAGMLAKGDLERTKEHVARGSFDAFPRLFDIIDPALGRLALIVRGADTGRPELTPQLPGLLALSQGLSATIADDHEMLAHGMVADDALYAWCRSQDRPSTAV